jgi:TolB protein
MNLRKIIYVSGLALFMGFLFTSMAQARVYLDITSPDFRKVPFAVPYFTDKNNPGRINKADRDMTALLTKALEFHGFISVVPPDKYGGYKNIDWPKLGVDFTIITDYKTSGGTMSFEFRLIDVAEGKMLIGKRYKGSPDTRHKMILRFCDEVIYQLTGERGISQSNITFASDVSGGYKEIFVADVLGRNIKQITRHKSLTVSPKFSPDGKTMVITLSKDGNPDLYLISKEGTILERFTNHAGINVSPAWSPDGKHITFVSDRSGTPQIYIMNVKTKSVRRITFQGNDNTEPSWSPDGEWIAYSGLYDGQYQIFKIKPEGGQALQLTWYRDDHESPSWSPDSRQVVFTRRHNDDRDICTVFRNGTGFRTLFQLKGHQSSPEWSIRMD